MHKEGETAYFAVLIATFLHRRRGTEFTFEKIVRLPGIATAKESIQVGR